VRADSSGAKYRRASRRRSVQVHRRRRALLAVGVGDLVRKQEENPMHSILPTYKAVDDTYADKIAVNVRARTLGRSTSLLGLTLGLLLLAGCAGSIPSSTRYEGVYQLTATPLPPSSRDPGCAPFTKNVVVRDGHLEFGDFEDSSDNRCQWHYAFQYEGTPDDAPQD